MVIPTLIRELLWTDLKTMDEFFELDPLNELFYEYLLTLKEEPFNIVVDEVKVFNEVYYLATSLVNVECLPEFEKEIYDDLRWQDGAALVLSMMYFIVTNTETVHINKYTLDKISDKIYGCIYWTRFYRLSQELEKENKKIKYSFETHPYPARLLAEKDIKWEEFTQGYELDMIGDLFDLWKDLDELKSVANLIEKRIKEQNYSPEFFQEYVLYKNFYLEKRQFEIITKKRDKCATHNRDNELEVENNDAEGSMLYPFITNSDFTDIIIKKLRDLVKGKKSPKDKMMPIRAAQDAGVIRRPKYSEIKDVFGNDFIAKSSYHNYTDPEKNPFGQDKSFELMYDDFKKLIK